MTLAAINVRFSVDKNLNLVLGPRWGGVTGMGMQSRSLSYTERTNWHTCTHTWPCTCTCSWTCTCTCTCACDMSCACHAHVSTCTCINMYMFIMLSICIPKLITMFLHPPPTLDSPQPRPHPARPEPLSGTPERPPTKGPCRSPERGWSGSHFVAGIFLVFPTSFLGMSKIHCTSYLRCRC